MSAQRLVAPALEVALALALARAGVLFALDRLGSGRELELVLFRLGEGLAPLVGWAVVAGLCGALLVRLGRSRAAAVLAVLATVLLFSAFLAGVGADDPSRRVGWDTSRGRLAAGACVGVALTLAVLLSARVRRPRRRDRAPWAEGVAVALALGGLAFAAPTLLSSRDSEMTIVDVVDELLAGASDSSVPGQVLTARQDAPPSTGVLTPSTSYRLDGADMHALVLPPPAAVELRIPPGSAERVLSARAGLDRSVFDGELPAGASVRFELALDGEPVFETEIPLEPVGDPPGSAWVLVGGAGGVPLGSGGWLRFATSVHAADGAELETERPLRVGFGGLTCELRTRVERTRSAPDAPNVVFLVMDTERVDRLSAYGYPRPTTPNLERLVARGRLFEAAHATSSWTWPSTGSLLTGLHPIQHGADSFTSSFLAESLVTLPEALQRVGFTTAAWSANPLIVPDKNFDQGFEAFERGGDSPRQSRTMMPVVIEWLRSIAGTRFFLYLQLMDPHAPLRPLPEMVERFAPELPPDFDAASFADLKMQLLEGGELDATVPAAHRQAFHDLYDAGVASGDAWLGAILDELEALGLTDETLIVYTSDHGEELFDRRLAGHGHTLFPELVHVPLVVAGPGIAAGERFAPPVSNRHLAPSLANWAGASFPDVGSGVDLFAPLAELRPGPVFFATTQGWSPTERTTPILGWREGDLVLHWVREHDVLRLYDTSVDPELRDDVAAERPQDVQHLRAKLEQHADALAATRVRSSSGSGASTEELLKAIGYVGD